MWMRTLPFARKFRFMDADDFFRFVGDRTYREVLGDKLVCKYTYLYWISIPFFARLQKIKICKRVGEEEIPSLS